MILITNEVSNIKDSNKLIKKFIKLKTRKIFNSRKSKNKKLSKS